jgi:hypothetical protein
VVKTWWFKIDLLVEGIFGDHVQATCLQIVKLLGRSFFMYKIPIRLTSIFASVLILLAMSSTVAEVYTWTDENGQKHFGDRTPSDYPEQSKRVDLNIHHPSEEDIRATAHNNSYLRHQLDAPVNEGETKPVKKKEKQVRTSKSDSEIAYEEQVAAYNKSEACYTACASQAFVHHPHNGVRVVEARDTSNCGHCTPMRKPSRPRF